MIFYLLKAYDSWRSFIIVQNVFDVIVGLLRTDAKGLRVVSLLREDIEIDRRCGGASCLVVFVLNIIYLCIHYITLHYKYFTSYKNFKVHIVEIRYTFRHDFGC